MRLLLTHLIIISCHLLERAKKQRVASAVTDDDDEVEESGEALSSFTSKLTKYKKAGSQSCLSPYFLISRAYTDQHPKARRPSQASDDDAFLIPSDSSIPTSSHRRSSSGSSASSLRSSAMDSDSDSFIAPDSDAEVGKAARKSIGKASKAKTSRPAPEKNTSNARGSNYSFLTAAEQREQDKKDEKKDTESPYSFLLDIKDVGFLINHRYVRSESSCRKMG